MSQRLYISRRKFITIAGAGAGSLMLAGCDRWSEPGSRTRLDDLQKVNRLTESVQRLFVRDTTLAREYSEEDISPYFRANGSTSVDTNEYREVSFRQFFNYRLEVSGLVQTPLSLSLDDLRAMPARTQITRHDCVEGWSNIGKWTGPQLSTVLDMAGVQPNARYVMFYCYDVRDQARLGPINYYESIGMADAYHPQTILAYGMNDRDLGISHGAPLRLRVERQLGYKMAKYIRAIEVVESFADIGEGYGGYYEDGDGYEWYAGI
jgi:DMSO/TMAO reductase YedYZ molybdopterin-dependent catalytic subunit